MTATIGSRLGSAVAAPSAPYCSFEPKDEFNKLLEANVHPPNYVNPAPIEEYDLVVIGAGVAGLLSVITAKWLGKKCALIEGHAMGGDCLNIGCVPSKALIAASRALANVRSCSDFGIRLPPGAITIDFGHVMQRMRKIRAEISHHDSVQRYAKEFCEHVFVGHGEFSPSDANTVIVRGDDRSSRVLRFRKAMIASGAAASIPPELHGIPHLTNANFFNLTELPPRMIVLGCGPIGLELAQAMSVFGCQVTCISKYDHIMPKEDPAASALVAEQMVADGTYGHAERYITGNGRSRFELWIVDNTSCSLSTRLFC